METGENSGGCSEDRRQRVANATWQISLAHLFGMLAGESCRREVVRAYFFLRRMILLRYSNDIAKIHCSEVQVDHNRVKNVPGRTMGCPISAEVLIGGLVEI